MSNIAIIDADIVGKKKHRFPNLCCMKISAYHKKLGDTVILKTDYNNLKAYESEFSSFYAAVAAWCNQPSIFNTFTFRLFCQCRGMRRNGYKLYKRDIETYLKEIGVKGSEWRAMEQVETLFPEIAEQYYDFTGKSNRRYI